MGGSAISDLGHKCGRGEQNDSRLVRWNEDESRDTLKRFHLCGVDTPTDIARLYILSNTDFWMINVYSSYSYKREFVFNGGNFI